MYIERLTESDFNNFVLYLNNWLSKRAKEKNFKDYPLIFAGIKKDREGLVTIIMNRPLSNEENQIIKISVTDVNCFFRFLEANSQEYLSQYVGTNNEDFNWQEEIKFVWKRYVYSIFGLEYIYKMFLGLDFNETKIVYVTNQKDLLF